MLIKDSLALDASGLSRSSDGYLVGTARVSKAGNVQQYLGQEIGLTGDDANKVFGVYRDPDVVFDADSMASLAGRPVTRDHPPAGVTADTWKALSVGAMGGRVVRDGDHVVASMAIMDSDAALEVERGARSLSAGYSVNVVKDSGTAPDGTPYQFRQAGPLRFNHVAYLPHNNPRAGDTRIGDGYRSWGDAPVKDARPGSKPTTPKGGLMPDSQLKTVVLGDSAVQVLVSDAILIEQFKKDCVKAIADAEAAKEAAEAKADAAEEENEELKEKISEDSLSKRVAAVLAATDSARKIAGPEFTSDSVSPLEIKRAAMVALKPKREWADKSAAYVEAAFDEAVERKEEEIEDEDEEKSKTTDSHRKLADDLSKVKTGDAQTTLDAAYQARMDRTANAWKEA
jgi:hypothetical protein